MIPNFEACRPPGDCRPPFKYEVLAGWHGTVLLLSLALEQAGCDEAQVLDHCREQEGHVKGCWVVDLLTGRL